MNTMDLFYEQAEQHRAELEAAELAAEHERRTLAALESIAASLARLVAILEDCYNPGDQAWNVSIQKLPYGS